MHTRRLQGKELAQLQRTIAALSTPPRPQNQQQQRQQQQQQQQHQQQGRSQQPPEWAELYDLYSSPDGGSSGSAQSGEQLGVFERGKQRQVAIACFQQSADCCNNRHRLFNQHRAVSARMHGVACRSLSSTPWRSRLRRACRMCNQLLLHSSLYLTARARAAWSRLAC